MAISYTIRPATEAEAKCALLENTTELMELDCIGFIGSFFEYGEFIFSGGWTDIKGELRTKEFMSELDDLITELRYGPHNKNGLWKKDNTRFLCDKDAVYNYCYFVSKSEKHGRWFIYRLDTDSHSYLFRLKPSATDYETCMLCFCYRRGLLDQYLHSNS